LIFALERHTLYAETVMMTSSKSSRINARITKAEEALLRRGAQRKGQTLTEFVVWSACAVAQLELAGQKDIVLPPALWQAFLAALDAPTEPSPALRRLLTEPSVLELANR
jgi:uncharacterized protein (DUF1778 family)